MTKGIQDELAKNENKGYNTQRALNKIIKKFSRECKKDVYQKIMTPKNPSLQSWAIVNDQYQKTMRYFKAKGVGKQNGDEAAKSIAQNCLQLRTLAENQPAAQGAPAALAVLDAPASLPDVATSVTPPALAALALAATAGD